MNDETHYAHCLGRQKQQFLGFHIFEQDFKHNKIIQNFTRNDMAYKYSSKTSLLFKKIRSIVLQIEFSLEPYYKSQPKQQRYWSILTFPWSIEDFRHKNIVNCIFLKQIADYEFQILR